ncbi:hypothetical protein [Caenimonas aquaedulcis]|uniref:Uncharacterized protein n=1 Tax=Caenimonas aquaedulcis TaxID=2793270 RepID=A0A931H2J4_9BURK|nr:hypothetical protein [Caenimonas aquaedulcis]MBG9387338.1 hypothetical protein [Caenimonas aquaedulcis]
MEEAQYHVVLDGRKIGPYDRRTIVGMRIKKALTSDHVLIGTDGSQSTVARLIGTRPPGQFNADRSQSFSVVQATFAAGLVEAEGRELQIPAFAGEVEVRVQGPVLRIAGTFRKGFGWRQDRVKLQVGDIVHARIRATQVDLWLRTGEAAAAPLRRVTLELFTPESAGELVEWFPAATPWPGGNDQAGARVKGDKQVLWAAGAAVGAAAVVLLVFVALAGRRIF